MAKLEDMMSGSLKTEDLEICSRFHLVDRKEIRLMKVKNRKWNNSS